MFVGASKLELKYPDAFFPHTGFRGRYLTEERDPLCVRSIYVSENEENMLFISIEVGDVGSDWLDDIARAAEVRRENIYMGATHTHAAPHVGGFWPEDVVDVQSGAAFAKMCKETVLESVKAAKSAARPAELRIGTGCCLVNINRDYHYTGGGGAITAPYIQAPNPEGISDKTVYIAEFSDISGNMIACIFSYAVHSNVSFFQSWDRKNGMKVTGDLAGTAMRYVEEHVSDGAVAAFFMGAAADQSPQYLSNHRVFDRDGNVSWEYYGQEAGYILMDAQGKSLGISVINGLNGLNYSKETGIVTTAGTLHLCSKLNDHGKKVTSEKPDNSYASQYKENLAADFSYSQDKPLDMPMYLSRIHDLNIVGIPAELVTSIGQTLRGRISEILGGQTFLFTQCNGAYSYIADEFGYKERTFEAVASHFMPGTASRIVEGVAGLAMKLKKSGECHD